MGEEDYHDDRPYPWECDHEDRDINPIDGRAICYSCGEAWFVSSEELAAEHEYWVEYGKWEKSQRRKQAWSDFWQSFQRFFDRLFPFQKSEPAPVDDDDIPF